MVSVQVGSCCGSGGRGRQSWHRQLWFPVSWHNLAGTSYNSGQWKMSRNENDAPFSQNALQRTQQSFLGSELPSAPVFLTAVSRVRDKRLRSAEYLCAHLGKASFLCLLASATPFHTEISLPQKPLFSVGCGYGCHLLSAHSPPSAQNMRTTV